MPDHNADKLFREWLVGHRGTVLKVARAYTITAEDCQDLAQEILLQVWRSLPQFQGRASASTWCYRVALNTALGWHRKERRRRARQRPLLAAISCRPPGTHSTDLVDRLYAAIRRLPGTDAALVLLHLDDLSYRQIAEVLGVSEGNIGVKLTRAKKALGELMKEEPMSPDPLQEAWQSQPHPPFDADRLVREFRQGEQRFATMIFWRDVREVGVSLVLLPVWVAMGVGIGLPWSWYLVIPGLVWIAAFMTIDRMRQRRRAGPGDSLVRGMESALADVEHQTWLLRNVFWWYQLPLAVPIMAFFAQTFWRLSRGGVGADGLRHVLCGRLRRGGQHLDLLDQPEGRPLDS